MRALAVLLTGTFLVAAPTAQAPVRPRLVVVVAVDQMRADFLTRFPELYHGGLARLIKEGAVFTDAHHNHAGTETAPGHATLSTGSFPSRSGIIANDWFERAEGRTIYSVDDEKTQAVGGARAVGKSPRRLKTNALGDWLKRASPRSKVFSVAVKDRAAVLMGGQKPDGAFWYDDNGNYVTSTYYARNVPAWVDSFNLTRPMEKYFATGWTRLLAADAYSASSADSVPEEFDGVHVTFPHLLTSVATNGKSNTEIKYTPFADEVTLRFAAELARREHMGQDNTPDILWVSCSAADYVGHRYGPFSQEAEDYYLRLDGYLADFFAFLDQTVGRDRYTVVLSADHGAQPLPEELARHGEATRRVLTSEANPVFNQAQDEVAAQLGLSGPLLAGYAEGLLLHYSAAKAKGINEAALQGAVAARFRQISFVADAFTATEMETGSGSSREYYEQFRHSYFKGRSPDVLLRFKPMVYLASSRFGTSHGSAYDYDTHVPLVFAGFGVVGGQHGERVATADLAATLARLLGITPTGEIDGKVLTAALR
ncbi:MAG: alkaline phosphatase family protein [Gemmatimonadetes bacterium]|nr:alkaline phosphatase family protein [Gemmatimonadota bacterium]